MNLELLRIVFECLSTVYATYMQASCSIILKQKAKTSPALYASQIKGQHPLTDTYSVCKYTFCNFHCASTRTQLNQSLGETEWGRDRVERAKERHWYRLFTKPTFVLLNTHTHTLCSFQLCATYTLITYENLMENIVWTRTESHTSDKLSFKQKRWIGKICKYKHTNFVG